MLLEASRACDDKPAAHVDSVDLLVVDVESSLGELLLPGIKALQVAFIVTHKAASQHNPLIHSFTHAFTTCLASRSGTHNPSHSSGNICFDSQRSNAFATQSACMVINLGISCRHSVSLVYHAADALAYSLPPCASLTCCASLIFCTAKGQKKGSGP